MNMKRKRFILLLGAFICVLLTVLEGLHVAKICSVNKTDKEVAVLESADRARVVVEYNGTPDLTITPNEMTVIDFNATWCGPCKRFAPIFHAVAEKHQGKAAFYSVDVDRNPELADRYGANAIPKVVVLFPDGTIHETVGLITAEELEELMRQ